MENKQTVPGTLKKGFNPYSMTALNRLFKARKVKALPYPTNRRLQLVTEETLKKTKNDYPFTGVQEKFSGTYWRRQTAFDKWKETRAVILKPIPKLGTRTDQKCQPNTFEHADSTPSIGIEKRR